MPSGRRKETQGSSALHLPGELMVDNKLNRAKIKLQDRSLLSCLKFGSSGRTQSGQVLKTSCAGQVQGPDA